MSTYAFSFAGLAFVFLVAIPAATLVAKLALMVMRLGMRGSCWLLAWGAAACGAPRDPGPPPSAQLFQLAPPAASQTGAGGDGTTAPQARVREAATARAAPPRTGGRASTTAGAPPHAQVNVPSRPVGLAQVLAHADTHAPAIRVARARLLRGDAAFAGARPWLSQNPTVRLGAGPRLRPDGTGTDLQGSLTQGFEVAGERGLRLESAARVQDRLEAELAQVRWRTHWEVHAAFHLALVARERAAVTGRLLAFQERLLDIAQRRLRAGDISPLPVRLAEGETAQARVAHIAAQQDFRAARLRMAELAGWPSSDPPTPAGNLDPPRKAPPLQRILQLAQRHQPALRSFAASLEEARAQLALADREGWPEPSLGVQAQREAEAEGPSAVVLGVLSVPVPLFQRNQRDRAAAHAELEIIQAEADAFVQRLRAVLARSASAVDAAAERVAAYGTEILPRFEENLRLLERAFELGEVDITQVSVARERFLRMQNDALDAYADYFQAVSELESAVGADLWIEAHHHPGAPDASTEDVP